MTAKSAPPKGSLARGLVGGGTAARMGGLAMKYAARKPFLSEENRRTAKREMTEKSAQALFNGLCQLKGTALKIAQLLSLELDVFPPEVRARLERSYNDVPPMNRALVRKALHNAYGAPPEEVFSSFEEQAFAAASLGQVHRAEAFDGAPLAVKIQYPGIRQTIRSDVRILKGLLRPFPEYTAIKPLIQEIETRFIEETDYRAEANNAEYFRQHLRVAGVRVPEVRHDLGTDRILCLSRLEGTPLNVWLKTGPSSRAVDTVAQTLEDVFIQSFYDLRRIHADPHPGNFIVQPDGRVGLVDFGCVKGFAPEFVTRYKRLPMAFFKGDSADCLQVLRQLNTLPENADSVLEEKLLELSCRYGAWLGRLFRAEVFDFGKETNFIRQGKEISMAMKSTLRQLTPNPEFVFLDRTRYGLLRLYERMQARVRFRNAHEWDASS